MPQKRPRVACFNWSKKKGALLLKDKGLKLFWSHYGEESQQLRNRDISEQNIMSLVVPLKTITFYLYRTGFCEQKRFKGFI